jgi:hypothetical protein
MPETKSDRIAPVRKSITVPWQPEAAFRRFTAGMADWWPGATCEIEGRVGGRVFETGPDGAEHLWGTVTLWEPPRSTRAGYDSGWDFVLGLYAG